MNTSAKGFGPARHFVPAPSTEFGLQEEIQTKFRLLSWNVLAPSWDNQGTKQSNWHARWARILQEVRVRKPDVMVLQEIEVLIYDDQIQPFFKARGYLSVYTGVDSGVGVAVFWRSSKFELKSATDFELSTTKLTPWRSLLDGSFNTQQQKRYATKPNMVLFVILTCVGQEEVRPHAILIGAVHLTANPAHHKPLLMDVQLFETNVLLDGMQEIIKQERLKYSSLNCILAGDFNVPHFFPESVFKSMTRHIENPAGFWEEPSSDEESLPSPVYELLTRGNLTAESIGFLMTAIKASGFHPSILLQGSIYDMLVLDRSPNVFISAYAKVIGTEPITHEGGTLDFVFFMPQQRRSDHSRPARLAVLGVLSPPVQVKRTSLVRSLGSDHLPLVVEFGLVTPLRKTLTPTAATAAVLAPAPENTSAVCSKSDVLEAVRQLESQVSNLTVHLSQPQMPQPLKECPGLLPELRLYLYASTCASMLIAASVLLYFLMPAALWRNTALGLVTIFLLVQGLLLSELLTIQDLWFLQQINMHRVLSFI
eukprot:s653_g2.t1